jgi:hypothetical protein
MKVNHDTHYSQNNREVKETETRLYVLVKPGGGGRGRGGIRGGQIQSLAGFQII